MFKRLLASLLLVVSLFCGSSSRVAAICEDLYRFDFDQTGNELFVISKKVQDACNECIPAIIAKIKEELFAGIQEYSLPDGSFVQELTWVHNYSNIMHLKTWRSYGSFYENVVNYFSWDDGDLYNQRLNVRLISPSYLERMIFFDFIRSFLSGYFDTSKGVGLELSEKLTQAKTREQAEAAVINTLDRLKDAPNRFFAWMSDLFETQIASQHQIVSLLDGMVDNPRKQFFGCSNEQNLFAFYIGKLRLREKELPYPFYTVSYYGEKFLDFYHKQNVFKASHWSPTGEQKEEVEKMFNSFLKITLQAAKVAFLKQNFPAVIKA